MAGLRIILDETSYSIANNTSVVSAVVQISSNGKSWSNYQCSGHLYVNGHSYSFTHTFSTSTSWQTVYTKTGITVPHNSDGSKTISSSATFTTGVSLGTLSATKSLTLTKIARKSTCIVNTTKPKYGDTVTFTIRAQSSGFTHVLRLGATGHMDWTTVFSGVASGNYTFTIPKSYAQYFTTTDNGIWLQLITYSGSTQIGITEYKPIMYLQPSDDMIPVITINCSDATTNYSTYGNYVQAQSRLQIQHNIAYSYNATGVARVITVNSSTYTSASDSTVTTTAAIQNVTNTVTVTVTDSRGAVGTASITITALPWYQPKCTVFNLERCSDSAGTLHSDTGTYLHATYAINFADVNSKNTKALAIEYKLQSATDYTVQNIPITTYTPSGSITIPNFLPTGSYDVRLTTQDAFGNYTTITGKLSTAEYPLHINASGKSFALGKASKYEEISEIARELIFYKSLYANDSSNTLQKLCYMSGDTISGIYNGAGYLTNSGTKYQFTIPVNKPIIGTSLTVTTLGIIVRQNNAYILGADLAPLDIASSATVSLTPFGINVIYNTSTASTGSVNNSPIGIYITCNFTVL